MSSVPQHTPGVYAIYDVRNRCTYIGSTINTIQTRWHAHMRELNSGKHICSPLQQSWNDHGPDNFRFTVLVPMPAQSEEAIRHAEQEQIELYRRQGRRLFNKTHNPMPDEPTEPVYMAQSWDWCAACGEIVPDRFGVFDRPHIFCNLTCWKKWHQSKTSLRV